MRRYVLIYEYGPDVLERRQPYRAAHLALAGQAAERGELLGGGLLGGDPAEGLFIFQGDGPEAATRFAEADPYVTAGVVARWRVREWAAVVGPLAPTPA